LDFDLHPRHFESSKNTARWGRHVIAIRAFYNCKAIAKKKKKSESHVHSIRSGGDQNCPEVEVGSGDICRGVCEKKRRHRETTEEGGSGSKKMWEEVFPSQLNHQERMQIVVLTWRSEKSRHKLTS
jgi:hypothetical protein